MKPFTTPPWVSRTTLTVGILVMTALGPVALAGERGDSGLPPGPGNPLADLQRQINELSGRLSALEESSQSLMVTVNCAAGERITDVQDRVANFVPRVTIIVDGICRESVSIWRDRITLQGKSVGDGLEAPSPTDTVLTLDGSHRTRLSQLALVGGSTGLKGQGGATFSAVDLHISGTGYGILVEQNVAGSLRNTVVENGGKTGILAQMGATLWVNGGLIENNALFGVMADKGGQVFLSNGAVVRNSGFIGVMAQSGGSINIINGATVEASGSFGASAGPGGSIYVSGPNSLITATGPLKPALVAGNGGAVWLMNGARVANNFGGGVLGFNGGSVNITNGAIVENNTGHGLELSLGSSGMLTSGSIIRGNTGDGIHLNDVSVVGFAPPEEGGQIILNNGGYGIFCAPPPAVAQFTGPATITGNGLGATNCPGPR